MPALIRSPTSPLALLLALLLALAPAWAADERHDPPARAGRVVELSGDAWLYDAEAREWTRLERNQTVAEGDRLRTDGRGRISLRIGSTSLWLDEDSELEFRQLDDGQVELELEKGRLALRLRSRDELNDTQLRTREGRFTPEREGLYRIDQLGRGSRGLAWEGSLRFDGRASDGALPTWVQASEQAEFWWADGGPRVERQAIARDEFSHWLLAQREAEGQSLAYRYVSPEMTGAEDLDRHGRWEAESEYGPLWMPTVVAADWAPYRHGRWVWSIRWGWTWVDAAPWGFAPFHYGRWVHWRGRWCWAPGSYVRRPVYAPALVAWVGGPAVSVGIGLGIGIGGGRPSPPRHGWVPLAPREAYEPAYRHSPGYWQRLNREHHPPQAHRRPEPPRQVGRPHAPLTQPQPRNLEVIGAVSTLPAQGGRPMPYRPGEAGQAAGGALTAQPAPGRGEWGLAGTPRETRPQPPNSERSQLWQRRRDEQQYQQQQPGEVQPRPPQPQPQSAPQVAPPAQPQLPPQARPAPWPERQPGWQQERSPQFPQAREREREREREMPPPREARPPMPVMPDAPRAAPQPMPQPMPQPRMEVPQPRIGITPPPSAAPQPRPAPRQEEPQPRRGRGEWQQNGSRQQAQ